MTAIACAAVAVAAIAAAAFTKGDKALGFWILAALALIGAAWA